jgi:transcriptional regulator with XRE-family HTH domain
VVNSSHRILDMEFPQRLSAIRKEKGLTQQKLAKLVGLHVAQVRRYEGGTSQPTLEVIRKLAVALSVSADTLLFDKDERGPDNDLRLQFEAISRFEPEEKQIRVTLDIIHHIQINSICYGSRYHKLKNESSNHLEQLLCHT